MQTPEPKQRNGALFYDLLNTPTTSHLSSCVFSDAEKYVLPNSTFSIQAVTHSWKYGQELQFASWSRTPPVLSKRAKDDSNFYRFEAGYMPLSHETAEQLRNVADQIDSIINYEPVTFQMHSRPTKVLAGNFRLEDVLI